MTYQEFTAALISRGFKVTPVSEVEFNQLEHFSSPYLEAVADKVSQGFDFMFWADTLLKYYKKGA